MFAYLRLPISWTELMKRTVRKIIDDNCPGLAAQLAFYFFLALFPALLFLVSLVSLSPVQDALDEMLTELGAVAPREAMTLLRGQLQALSANASGRLLTIGMVGALWSSSAAMMAIINTLNQAYDIEERRPWWKARLLAIVLTIGLAVFMIISFALIMVGPAAARLVGGWMELGDVFVGLWVWLRWPVAFFLVVLAMDLIYHFGPDAESVWVWLTPGSLLATVLWIAVSVAFRFYVSRFGHYNITYGAIGSVIVLLLWFYFSAFTILIGAELNAEIDHAVEARQGAQRSPGEKRKIGLLLQRRSIKSRES